MSVNKVQLANGETIIDISDSTVTPETLAEGVTAHDASGRKITGKMIPGGGASVQTDWNQTDETAPDFLKNKPFGETPTGGDTLTWDGNTDGVKCFEDSFYKMSDSCPTLEELQKGIATICFPERKATASGDEICVTDEGGGLLMITMSDVPVLIVIPNAPEVIEAGIEPGTYFVSMGGVYTTAFTIPGYTGFPKVHKIDNHYLPETVVLYADSNCYLYPYPYVWPEANEENRITMEVLQSILLSTSKILVSLIGVDSAYLLPIAITFNDGYGRIAAIEDVDVIMDFYTAEYTPTTT